MKDRIHKLMSQQHMSQKEFANELCIAEGTLSGIYNGRTKPSNAIVSAIHERFPDVSIPWLMFGEGDMYVTGTVVTTPQTHVQPPVDATPDLFSTPQMGAPQQPVVRETIKYIDKPQRKITEIRVFFDDGTFETYSPQS